MFGITYNCDTCDFEFCSGWSHHAADQFMVCNHCGCDYVLAGGDSCWGTQEGERLQLFAFDGENDVATGCFTTVRDKSDDMANAQMIDGVSRLQLAPLQCPNCNKTDTMLQSFNDGDPCPRCDGGRIKQRGSCIY
ncbi:hypothetical protein OAK85_04935 [Mariniblastus sp.]|nr:hypothetical protein [Mariniblastus sp.]